MGKLSLSLLSVALMSAYATAAETELNAIERVSIIGSSQAVNDLSLIHI